MASMEVTVSGNEPMPPPSELDGCSDFLDNDRLQETLSSGALDFDEWTLLISEIENSFPDDIEKLCFVYDAFLLEFPLCHGYWRKYAYHKIQLCALEDAVEVFERAVQKATYSVAVWLDYCTFAVAAYEDPLDVSRLFERGISFVGKDYSCCTLWDKYIEFLLSQKQWSSLAHTYLRTLRYPSKKLHFYYKNFRRNAASMKEKLKCRIDVNEDLSSDPMEEDLVPTRHTDEEISIVIRDLMGPSSSLAVFRALHAYFSIGEQFYQDSLQLMEKISGFEMQIHRPYFHVNPLDTKQLDNWHAYLSFAETYGDFDWAIKLYERCLIPCANYTEFWFRYVDFVESKGGRELANFALGRASQTFVKDASVIHLFNARFKEHAGDASAASVALSRCGEELGFGFVENVTKKANMEKRLGNFEAAVTTYREALKKTLVGKENLEIAALLYVQFSRLKYMITNNAEEAAKILIEGNEKVPHGKLLLEELIRLLMMHGGSRKVELLDPIIDKEISHQADSSDGLSAEDKEEISNLYMEFIDLSGTIHDVRKALGRHIKLFPHSARAKSHVSRPSGKSFKELLQKREKTRVSLTQEELPKDNGIGNTVTLLPEEKKALPVDTVKSDAVEIQPSGSRSPSCSSQSYQNQDSLRQTGRNTDHKRDLDQNHRDSRPRSQISYPPVETGRMISRQHPSVAPLDNQAAVQSSISQNNPQNHCSSQMHPTVQTSNAYPQTQNLGQMHMSVAPSENPATLQSSNSQNQYQDPASQVQTPFAYPYPQQEGQMQSNEAYNQMWQQYYYYYYYYQQQQQLQSVQPPQPNQNPQPQLDQNLLQLLSRQCQSHAGTQYPQSQQLQEPQNQQQLQFQQQQWQQQQQQQLQGEVKSDEQRLSMPQVSTRESDIQKSQESGGNEADKSSDTSISSI